MNYEDLMKALDQLGRDIQNKQNKLNDIKETVKVCRNCYEIVYKDATMCPVCKSKRFK